MKHKKESTRLLSLVLTLVMLFGMLPTAALATESEATAPPAQTEESTLPEKPDDDQATEPNDAPTEPGDAPTEPGDEPTEPGDAPTEPGDVPAEPGDEPTEPGDAATGNSPAPMAADDIASGTDGRCDWVVDAAGKLTISPTDGGSGVLEKIGSGSYLYFPWAEKVKLDQIKSVVVKPGVSTGSDLSNMFSRLSACTEIDLTGLDTSAATNMERMFCLSGALTSLKLGEKFNTGNVTNMREMFDGCKALTSLELGKNFNTSNVTDMSQMFSGCSALKTLTFDVDEFKTSNVTTMSNMFAMCENLTSLDVSKFDTTNVTNMEVMFAACAKLTSLDVSNFNTTNVTDMGAMFSTCRALTEIDLNSFNTDKVTNMGSMFRECLALTSLDVSKFNTTNVTDMQFMFEQCKSLTALDVSGFDTKNVTSMSNMFRDCELLTELDVKGFRGDSVTDMYRMFYRCGKLTSLDLSGIDTTNVTTIHEGVIYEMFYECKALSSITFGAGFDKPVTLPAAYPVNHEEAYGWYRKVDGEEEKVAPKEGGTYSDPAGTTAYVKRPMPKVTFNSMAQADFYVVEVDQDGTATMPDTDPTWEDYRFEGWFTNYDGQGDPVTAEAVYTEDTEVYAKWTKNGKLVRTETISLSNEMESEDRLATEGWAWDSTTSTITLNNALINTPQDPSIVYDFDSDDELATAPPITLVLKGNNTAIGAQFAIGITSDSKFTIKGEGSLHVESSIFAIQAGGDLSIEGGTITAIATGSGMAIALLAMGDLSIANAQVTAKGSFTVASMSGITIPDGVTITGSTTVGGTLSDAKVASVYHEMFSTTLHTIVLVSDETKPVQHTVFVSGHGVTFDTLGGPTVDSVEIGEDGTIPMPANPTWGSYTFGGWYKDKAYTQAFENSGLSNGFTLYAKWTKNGKTVVTQPFDLRVMETTDKLTTEGWKWDADTYTLTLSGLTLNSAVKDVHKYAYGMYFPNTACTIILTDNTENTVDISAVKDCSNSTALDVPNGLTIKTSGKGVPGKLSAIAGDVTEWSIGIYAGPKITIESGNITATAGDAGMRSIGIFSKVELIKGGNITATAGDAGERSLGILSDEGITIEGGNITATAGESASSIGIFGSDFAKLYGDRITAEGKTAAIQAKALFIDDRDNVTVNGELVMTGDADGLQTLIDEAGGMLTTALIQFRAAYKGTNPLAPSASKAIKNPTSITLEEQTIPGEMVEYGIDKDGDGTITWQLSNTFEGLTADTAYSFYARVMANTQHKSGPASSATSIRTKPANTTVSGRVTSEDGKYPFSGATVKLIPSTPELTTTTDIYGAYTFPNVPAGVYSLLVIQGHVTVTERVVVGNAPVTVDDVPIPVRNKSTFVESTPETPAVAVGGMNALLNSTNISTTLTADEKAAVDAFGKVVIKLVADKKAATDDTIGGDKNLIEAAATDKSIGMFIDLKVLKTVTKSDGVIITNERPMEDLEGLIQVVLPIPEDLQGRDGLTIYRVHGAAEAAEAEELTEEPNGDGEKVEFSVDGSYATLHLKKFSTYAIGYTAYEVTVDGGDGATGAGKYGSPETVTISAGTKSGHIFDGWTVTEGTVTLANTASATTSFIMPAANVTVTANWKLDDSPSDDSSSSSDDVGATTYPNTVKQPENGTVSIAPRSPSKGQTVTITTKPDAGYVVDAVIVKDANGKTIAVTEQGMNSYTFVQPGSKVTVEVTYKKAATSGEKTFTDVTTNDWFYDAVMTATAKGWFSGTSETTFAPNMTTSRGMIATILHNMERAPSTAASSFADVPSDAYYANGVAWVQEHGIVAGYGNGNYGPNDAITREQLVSILYRYAQYKGCDMSKTAAIDGFTDAGSISPYAGEAMRWAVGNGIISGRGNDTLAPTASATRAEVATILVRLEMLFAK